MPKMKIRKNDSVVVISGKDRGTRGRVLQVMPSTSRILVEGVNIIKRHTKANPQKNIQGGVVERESMIHVSNVMIYDPDTEKPSRIGSKILQDGSRVRIARRSGAVLDK
jgi:large subunit ribosomal protein L24